MGCNQSTPPSPASSKPNQTDNKKPCNSWENEEVEFVKVEPDLGWRRVLTEEAERLADLFYVSHPSPSTTTPLLPYCLTPSLFNERTSSFCSLPLMTIGISICIRAVQLANKFGILPPPPGSNGWRPWEEEEEDVHKIVITETEKTQKIYDKLEIPDYDWQLLARLWHPPHYLSRTPKKAEVSTSSTVKRKGAGLARGYEGKLLSAMRSGESGGVVVVDVGEIGLNISEQLNRLEKQENNKLPDDLFGWKTEPNSKQQLQQCIISPDGFAFSVVPEELIMNATTWIQRTYLTQPLLLPNSTQKKPPPKNQVKGV